MGLLKDKETIEFIGKIRAPVCRSFSMWSDQLGALVGPVINIVLLLVIIVIGVPRILWESIIAVSVMCLESLTRSDVLDEGMDN